MISTSTIKRSFENNYGLIFSYISLFSSILIRLFDLPYSFYFSFPSLRSHSDRLFDDLIVLYNGANCFSLSTPYSQILENISCDQYSRIFNYPRSAIALGYLFSNIHPILIGSLLCSIFVFLFYVLCLNVSDRLKSSFINIRKYVQIIFFLIFISPPVQLLLERCNVDILVYITLFILILPLLNRRSIYFFNSKLYILLNLILLTILAVFRIYPVLLITCLFFYACLYKYNNSFSINLNSNDQVNLSKINIYIVSLIISIFLVFAYFFIDGTPFISLSAATPKSLAISFSFLSPSSNKYESFPSIFNVFKFIFLLIIIPIIYKYVKSDYILSVKNININNDFEFFKINLALSTATMTIMIYFFFINWEYRLILLPISAFLILDYVPDKTKLRIIVISIATLWASLLGPLSILLHLFAFLFLTINLIKILKSRFYNYLIS